MADEIVSRYEIAKVLIEGNLSNDLVINDGVLPFWISGTNSFWYLRHSLAGREYRLVDTGAASNELAFDHWALSRAFEAATTIKIDPLNLPITVVDMTLSPMQIYFKAFSENWVVNIHKELCERISDGAFGGLVSPDGKKIAFIRSYNVWLREIDTDHEKALTTDGTSDFPYSVAYHSICDLNPSGVEAVWSSDSQQLLTYQLDLRKVAVRKALFPVKADGSKGPEYHEFKAAFPGDRHVESYRLIIIQQADGKVIEADHPYVPMGRLGYGYFSEEQLGWWASDNTKAYFVVIERGAKVVRVMEFDAQTGATRALIEENSDTFVRLSHALHEPPIYMPLPETQELIWFSERDGWGHLYLYDLESGGLKYRLTEGNWLVRSILHFDATSRELLVQTSGREPDISPYYQNICRLNLDSRNVTSIVSGPYDYNVFGLSSMQAKVRISFGLDAPGVSGISPSGKYIVTTRSRVDTMPTTSLYDSEGCEILIIEEAEMTGLPKDWHWPEPFKVMSADGKTDLYGVIFRPPGYLPDESYPVIDFCNAFPFCSSLPQGSFVNDPYGGDTYLSGASYAALGFIVVALDVPGMPYRSKWFQDQSYGDISSVNAFEDRICGLKALAERYPYMDLNRVGIVGCDWVTGPVYGMLKHPEFYKVGVNVAFDDSRYGVASLVEMYEGVKVPERPYTDELLSSLTGKLLLIHGMRDTCTPPETTMQLADGLQKSGMAFDMMLEASGEHIVTSYGLRCTWDYLVKHLLNEEPPSTYHLTTAYDRAFKVK